MSEEKMELGFCDQLKQQHHMFCVQRDQAQVNLQQLVGAIYACEQMIKKYEESEQPKESVGDQGNGQVDEQAEEQSA